LLKKKKKKSPWLEIYVLIKESKSNQETAHINQTLIILGILKLVFAAVQTWIDIVWRKMLQLENIFLPLNVQFFCYILYNITRVIESQLFI
jgi:D-alanyl-lipoteichoic acid acyltransferase DltB (MBOAT superfamily)